MENRKCRNCIFGDMCSYKISDCSDYAPVDEFEDIGSDEESRQEFYRVWFQYIGEYDDDLFF